MAHSHVGKTLESSQNQCLLCQWLLGDCEMHGTRANRLLGLIPLRNMAFLAHGTSLTPSSAACFTVAPPFSIQSGRLVRTSEDFPFGAGGPIALLKSIEIMSRHPLNPIKLCHVMPLCPSEQLPQVLTHLCRMLFRPAPRPKANDRRHPVRGCRSSAGGASMSNGPQFGSRPCRRAQGHGLLSS